MPSPGQSDFEFVSGSGGCHVTIELEDLRHARTRAMGIPAQTSPETTRRGLERILEALDDAAGKATATIFTTGQVARAQPRLVADLAAQGHEIACHGDTHDSVKALDRYRFAASLERALDSLAAASGGPVEGFRAPDFSVDGSTGWAFEILAEHGLVYDSSLTLEGRRGAARAYDDFAVAGRRLCEFPLCRVRLGGGIGIRVIGGAQLRLLPTGAALMLMRRAAAQGFVPIVYLRPADIAEGYERVRRDEMNGLGPLARAGWTFRQLPSGAGAGSAAAKLRAILAAFPNRGTLRDALDAPADPEPGIT